ncbi:MAG: phosphoenolpyruvate synthase, partial [Anaerolineae bacterium]|nr:phosphoenolpyruvate synthase [Anaerolineae bacterium]
MVPRAGGGTDEVAQDFAARPALSDAEVLALAQMAQRVAAHFGSPQDIEWALADSKLHLLQSRPITSLYPLPSSAASDDNGLRFYFSFNALQGIPEPITPFGISTIKLPCRVCFA